MPLRRSAIAMVSGGSWTPLRFGGDLRAWWDCSRLSGADADTIADIPDLSGNANGATQSTAAKKPTLKVGANGINNLNVARGDGVDDIMNAYSVSNVYTGTDIPHTTFAVVRKNGSTGSQDVCGAGSSSSSSPVHIPFRTNAGVDWRILRRDDANVIVQVTDGAPNTSPVVLVSVFLGTTVSFYKDGVGSPIGTSQDVGVLTMNRFTLFGLNFGGVEASFLNGDIGELGVINRALTDSVELNTLIGYLGTKWGISVSTV